MKRNNSVLAEEEEGDGSQEVVEDDAESERLRLWLWRQKNNTPSTASNVSILPQPQAPQGPGANADLSMMQAFQQFQARLLQQEDRAAADNEEVHKQSVKEFEGDSSEAAERDGAESKIDSFLHRRCKLSAASENKETPARRKRGGTAKPCVSKSKCDEKRLKISLKDISTRTELATALGVHVRAISLVTMTSEKCSTYGCSLLAARSNCGRCILCQRTWFPHNSTKRGWGLYGRQFLNRDLSLRDSKGIPSKHGSPCCCENPLCKKIGYSHEGMMRLPTKPDRCEEFLELLGIASRERRKEMARSPRSFSVAPWHYRPEHRERKTPNGRWGLRQMEYEDAEGNVRPFAPPDGDLQQFIDYEIPGSFRAHDDELPGWVAKLARMQDGVAGPGDVETINEGSPSFPPLPSSCAVEEEDAKTHERREDEKPGTDENDEQSNSQQSVRPPQPDWEQLFFQLVLYRARHGGSCKVPKRHRVHLPGLPSADLGEFIRTMREHKRVLRLAEEYDEGVPHQLLRRYLAATSVLTRDRIEALDSIGFPWEEPAKKVRGTWEERYEELARHHAEHGDCKPTDNLRLLKWCYSQRQSINNAMKGKGRSNPSKEIMMERKAKLDELNFIWRKQTPSISWEERMEALKQFKEEHGHCNVSKYHHPSLGHWVNMLRNNYRNKIEGKKSRLTEERILHLESIGFQWQLKKRHSKKIAQSQDEEEEEEEEDY